MGCISSKVTRTTSVRDRRNHHGGSVTTWEELLASHSGKDKLFSLVATKLTNSSFTMPLADHEAHQQTVDDLNLISQVSRKTEVLVESATGATESNSLRFARSRSCQEPRKNEDALVPNNGNDGIGENRIGWRDKNLAGSISFHTVEEYDALLERIRRFSTRKIDHDPWDDVEVAQVNSLGEDQDDRSIQIAAEEYNDFEKVAEVDGHAETGWKRKSMAKGLKSLDLSTAQFSGIARFKQRHHVESHIYSPGTYVTPKFGSYNAKAAPAEEEKRGEEDSVFSPQLVAAFEDCMQQLQEEEDSILTHMDEEYSQLDDVLENRVGTKHPSSIGN